MKKQYIVLARKNGYPESHNYIVAIHSSKERAVIIADKHADYRYGKYACIIFEAIENVYEDDNYLPKEVYRSKSNMEIVLKK